MTDEFPPPLPSTGHRERVTLQGAPTHWTWTRYHKPRWCLLCQVERWGVRLGLLVVEQDSPNEGPVCRVSHGRVRR